MSEKQASYGLTLPAEAEMVLVRKCRCSSRPQRMANALVTAVLFILTAFVMWKVINVPWYQLDTDNAVSHGHGPARVHHVLHLGIPESDQDRYGVRETASKSSDLTQSGSWP